MTTTDSSPGPASGRGRWGLLTHRDFRRFWFGETTSRFGTGVTAVALPLIAVVTLDASTTTIGLLTASSWLPWLVFGLPAGAWVARLPTRPLMIICNLVAIPPLVSVPIAAWLGVLTVPWLLAVALLTGTTAVLFSTALQVYLPSLVGPADLVEGNAKLQGSYAAAQVAGPSAAGMIAHQLGPATGLLADALTFVVSAGCLASIRGHRPGEADGTRGAGAPPDPAAANARREPMARAIASGLRFVWKDPYLRAITEFGATANLALTAYETIAVVFLIRDLGLDSAAVGWVMATAGLGGLVGALVARRLARRFGTARIVLLCQLAMAPVGSLMPLASRGAGIALYLAGSLSIVTAVVIGNVVLASFRQGYCPPRLLSRVAASAMVVNFGTIPLGGLIGGFLGTAVGNRAGIWLAMLVLAVAGLPLLASPMRTRRDLPVSPPSRHPSG